MAVRVSALEAARAAAKPPDNLEAYDLILRARSLYARGTRTALSQARPLFEKAIELDPVRTGLRRIRPGELDTFAQGWTSNPAVAMRQVEALPPSQFRSTKPAPVRTRSWVGPYAVRQL